jgi:hypothetical protein
MSVLTADACADEDWKGGSVKKMGGLNSETAPGLLTKHWQALTTNSNNSLFEMKSAGLSAFSLMALEAMENKLYAPERHPRISLQSYRSLQPLCYQLAISSQQRLFSTTV